MRLLAYHSYRRHGRCCQLGAPMGVAEGFRDLGRILRGFLDNSLDFFFNFFFCCYKAKMGNQYVLWVEPETG